MACPFHALHLSSSGVCCGIVSSAPDLPSLVACDRIHLRHFATLNGEGQASLPTLAVLFQPDILT